MFRKYLALKSFCRVASIDLNMFIFEYKSGKFVLCDSDKDYILSYGLSNQLNKFA